MDNLKKRIQKLERDRQPVRPVPPPKGAEVRELTDQEFMELYRQEMGPQYQCKPPSFDRPT